MNKLGLYLHFPFCKAKCAYCDFFSLSDLSRRADYERALARAVRSLQGELSDYTVETVYFGGGTPSLFSPDGLRACLSAIRESARVSSDAEITLECNPESTTEDVLSAARESGVNRLSFGMQSARDGELACIGRLHRNEKTVSAVRLARGLGFENISLDLMYGLPGQDLASFRESLEACLALNPRHISFYCLTLSPEVPLYEKRESLPSEEAVREMYLFAHQSLVASGFEHYEISNAALPGFRSRHNEGYWTGREYLGLGPGAHSYFGHRRFFTEPDTDRFIFASNPRDMFVTEETVTEDDLRTEYVMLSLRLAEGIDLSRLAALSDADFCRRAEEKLSLWSRHGLCRKTSKGYALTPEGFFVSNEIISELI